MEVSGIVLAEMGSLLEDSSSLDYDLDEIELKVIKVENVINTNPMKEAIVKNCKCVIQDCMWSGQCEELKDKNKKNQDDKEDDKKDEEGDDDGKDLPSDDSLKPHSLSDLGMPQTPPMSDDDEDSKAHSKLLLMKFKDNASETESEEDLLNDYFNENIDQDEVTIKEEFFEEMDVEEEEEEEEDEQDDKDMVMAQIRAFQNAAESDHSYHKNNLSYSSNLGIDTPSDSDEEIDVVSVDKYKKIYGFPTNPSIKMKDHIMKTMATAVNYKRVPQGIKTISPMGRPSTSSASISSASTTPSRQRVSRGVRKQYATQHRRPYRRRMMYGHSSDSDQEPSEKRNLHNNMERQRRIDLRNLFDNLKSVVPDLVKRPRAPKVVILRAAAQYCQALTRNDSTIESQKIELKRRQKYLRAHVSKLRKSLAATR